ADRVRGAQLRRDLHRPGQRHHAGLDAALAQPRAEQARIRGRDALPGQLHRLAVIEFLRYGDGQPAAPEAQRPQLGQRLALRSRREAEFVEHIAAHDAQLAHALRDQAGNVVVAYQQQVHRLAFAEAEQLVAALPEREAAALEQLQRRLGEPAGFLHRDTQAVTRLHARTFFDAVRRREARAAAAR